VNAYFGEPWDVPATEGQPHVPTPVGKPCLWCSVPIADGDRGFMVGWARRDDDGEFHYALEPQHRECQLRAVVGSPAHLDGNCTHHGGEGGDRPQTPAEARAEAIEVWDRINSGRF
jgi:hypothetical protein